MSLEDIRLTSSPQESAHEKASRKRDSRNLHGNLRQKHDRKAKGSMIFRTNLGYVKHAKTFPWKGLSERTSGKKKTRHTNIVKGWKGQEDVFQLQVISWMQYTLCRTYSATKFLNQYVQA
jgi:hypothetical protein